jgi:hypothetical protein
MGDYDKKNELDKQHVEHDDYVGSDGDIETASVNTKALIRKW